MVATGFPQLFDFKGVLLDLDNTIYAYEPCHHFALRACYGEFNKVQQLAFEDFSELYTSARTRIHTDLAGQGASHSRLLYFQKMVEQRFGKSELAITLQLDRTYWLAFIRHMKITTAAREFLIKCREKGIAICALTDLTAHIQFEKLLYHELTSFFSYIVTSEEAGVEKPHSYIFKLALEKLQLSPEDVVVIGDSIEKDINGARNLRIRHYLVTPEN
jgi:putative hydrolase of the HAD superfamily